MPATYRKRGANSEDYKRRSWMPEPVKPVDRRIFGYEVETSIFKKYNHQNYSIGFGFYDLTGVERWATDPERAAEFPEMAAEAKQIMERIIAEITGKDTKTMKTPRTAADFIDALNQIYTESRGIYDDLQDAVNKAKSKMDRAQEEMKNPACNRDIAEAQYAIARGEYQLAESERRNRSRTMQEEHAKKVAELRGQFVTYLNDHYSASPDKLDAATMQLLNSGICTPSELSRLVDRHADNPTMLRIIGNYARNMCSEKAKSMSYDDVHICASVANAALAAKDGSRELAIFDSAVSTMAYGLGSDYDHATRMHSHVSGWLEDFKNQIVNLPNMPAEDNNNTEE